MSTTSSAWTTAALAYVDQHRSDFLEELKALLRIPSISTLPKHKKDVKRSRQIRC